MCCIHKCSSKFLEVGRDILRGRRLQAERPDERLLLGHTSQNCSNCYTTRLLLGRSESTS